MQKKIAGLLGAMATLGAVTAAQAAPTPAPSPTDVLKANSFAELLEPIPNAASLLLAVDESGASAHGNVQLAQYHHHHHHHGMRRVIRRMMGHHHHHHHHHHFRHHHHHHHHHHHM